MNNDYEEDSNLELSDNNSNELFSNDENTESSSELQNDNLSEEYFPEEINPNTSFGQYKLKQQKLQQEAEAIKQRQIERTERQESKNPREEEVSDNKQEQNEEKIDDSTVKDTTDNSNGDNKDSNAKSNDKQDNEKKENGIRSKIDRVGGKIDDARAKINKVQQTANKVTHPVSAAKDEIKKKLKKKFINFLIQWWWLVGIIVTVFLLFILILLIFLGDADDSGGELLFDPYYDFNLTMVNVTNDYINEGDKIELERITLRDYLLGAAYYEFNGKLEDLSSSEALEVYKTFFIVAKSRLLQMGNYDVSTKEITIRSGLTHMPYCNVFFGCKVVSKGGVNSYISSNNDAGDYGTVVATINPASNETISLLSDAYNDTKYLLLVPTSFEDVLTNYSIEAPIYNSEIKTRWIEDSAKYDGKIKNTPEYANFKIYNIIDYSLACQYATDTAYWWPIGSLEPTHGNIYGGTPSVTYVSSRFGPRTIQGHDSYHHGIDIASGTCEQNVIIATRSGEVIQVEDGCPSRGSYRDTCNGGLGNYVRISHLDGYVSLYAHMTLDSIVVEVGQHVNQGQKLGTMGSSGSSTGCHLHFGIAINGSYVDPQQYISADNPRPTYNLNDPTNVDASSNKQSVCLSLKSTGFSDNAVAAIMTNIQAESGFNPQALGDNGTSYGLCQWHNGRYTSLQSYCGSEYTSVHCQLRYLLNELQTSYKSVYNMLLTNNSAYELASYYCINFEVPYNRYVNCPLRAENYAMQMLGYVTNGCR